MKILFDHPLPFALAHGGFQIQIEQTVAAIERQGVQVEFVRWWDNGQTGDIIHYFGRPTGGYIDFAHAKGMKVVVEELLSGLGSRPAPARFLQKCLMQISQTLLPKMFTAKLAWDCYQKADAFIANTEWEAHLMRSMFGADGVKVHVIPNGVEEIFFSPSGIENIKSRADYLVCTATIHPRKRVLELGLAAAHAKIPVRFIGKPYSESDPYYLHFLEIQRQHPQWIHYQGEISDRAELARIYQEARGFVLLSTMETHSLSAFEAAAAECPLLLSDLPWARSVFGSQASYASGSMRPENLSPTLRDFFENAPSLQMKLTPPTWDEIGARFQSVYKKMAIIPLTK